MPEYKIGKYSIDPVLFEKGFAKGCGPFHCETTCCSSGVFLDPTERDVILEHKEEVKAMMDETQTPDESLWFDNRRQDDIDFPSGYAVGTEVFNNKCVFLRKDGRCSVQLVSKEKYNDPWKIKPFYCVAFPICIENGVLTYDDYQDGATKCCSIVENNERPLTESCRDELKFILGEEQYQELLAMKTAYDSKK